MGVAPVSGTGQATKRPTNATSRKWHWLTRWATKLNKPIGAATLSKRGVSLWRHGLAISGEFPTLLLSLRESRNRAIGSPLQDKLRSRARRRIWTIDKFIVGLRSRGALPIQVCSNAPAA